MEEMRQHVSDDWMMDMYTAIIMAWRLGIRMNVICMMLSIAKKDHQPPRVSHGNKSMIGMIRRPGCVCGLCTIAMNPGLRSSNGPSMITRTLTFVCVTGQQ
jgi:hypothetical protein